MNIRRNTSDAASAAAKAALYGLAGPLVDAQPIIDSRGNPTACRGHDDTLAGILIQPDSYRHVPSISFTKFHQGIDGTCDFRDDGDHTVVTRQDQNGVEPGKHVHEDLGDPSWVLHFTAQRSQADSHGSFTENAFEIIARDGQALSGGYEDAIEKRGYAMSNYSLKCHNVYCGGKSQVRPRGWAA